jgi:hypothetical protein
VNERRSVFIETQLSREGEMKEKLEACCLMIHKLIEIWRLLKVRQEGEKGKTQP